MSRVKRKRCDDSFDQHKKQNHTLPQRSWYEQLYELIYDVVPEYDVSSIVCQYSTPSINWTYIGQFVDSVVWDMFQTNASHLMNGFRITAQPSTHHRMIGIGVGADNDTTVLDPWKDHCAKWSGFYTFRSDSTNTDWVACRWPVPVYGDQRMCLPLDELAKRSVSMSVYDGNVCFSVDSTHSRSHAYTGDAVTVCVGNPIGGQRTVKTALDQLLSSVTVEPISERPLPSPSLPIALGDAVRVEESAFVGTVACIGYDGKLIHVRVNDRETIVTSRSSCDPIGVFMSY